MRPKLTDIERKQAEARIESDRREFERTKNPLHAWAALLDARQPVRDHGPVEPLPIPEWVIGYLEEAAISLLSGSLSDWQPDEGQMRRQLLPRPADVPRGDRPAAVAVALGLWPKRRLRGRPSPDAFDEFGDTRAFTLALDVQWHRSGGETFEDAIAIVSSPEHGHGASERTVARAWAREKANVIGSTGACTRPSAPPPPVMPSRRRRTR
jgi:hypothetical protein